MKQALTIGCGSRNSRIIIDTLLQNNYRVTNMGSNPHPGCENILIEWQELQITNLHLINRPTDIPVDFLFFNHNASSLELDAFAPSDDTLKVWRLIKDWQTTHWIACQMPILMLHYLRKNLHPQSKVGWMLSGTMYHDRVDAVKYPDYSSQKYFNFLAMKGFSEHYQTFGILPDFSRTDSQSLLHTIIDEVCYQDVNGKIFQMCDYVSTSCSPEVGDRG